MQYNTNFYTFAPHAFKVAGIPHIHRSAAQIRSVCCAEEASSPDVVAEVEVASARGAKVEQEAESGEVVQPASLSKAQTAAAERAAGEEVGETGARNYVPNHEAMIVGAQSLEHEHTLAKERRIPAVCLPTPE